MPKQGRAIFRNSVQKGLFTIFKSNSSRPLELWDLVAENGTVSQFIDPQIRSMVFNITGTNVSTTHMTCPKGNDVLGIHMPYFVMVVKNMHKYFTFEITIADEGKVRRRFRVANFQSSTTINPFCTAMPIGLAPGWNQIMFNLADFTRRAYGRTFCEVLKVKINANICLRRVYFAERIIPDEELPRDYKLFLPKIPPKKLPPTSACVCDKEKVKLPCVCKKVPCECNKPAVTVVFDKENLPPPSEAPEKPPSIMSIAALQKPSSKMSVAQEVPQPVPEPTPSPTTVDAPAEATPIEEAASVKEEAAVTATEGEPAAPASEPTAPASEPDTSASEPAAPEGEPATDTTEAPAPAATEAPAPEAPAPDEPPAAVEVPTPAAEGEPEPTTEVAAEG